MSKRDSTESLDVSTPSSVASDSSDESVPAVASGSPRTGTIPKARASTSESLSRQIRPEDLVIPAYRPRERQEAPEIDSQVQWDAPRDPRFPEPPRLDLFCASARRIEWLNRSGLLSKQPKRRAPQPPAAGPESPSPPPAPRSIEDLSSALTNVLGSAARLPSRR